jgi:RNA recognition motif-containing protein
MKYGVVKKAYIIKDHKTHQPKGFGFVEFKHIESARLAVETPNHTLNGKVLTCSAFKEESDENVSLSTQPNSYANSASLKLSAHRLQLSNI